MSRKEATVEYFRTDHEPKNLAYRVQLAGFEMVYTGDTGYSRAVATLSEGFMHSFTRQPSCGTRPSTPWHEAFNRWRWGKIAEEAKAKKLLLTHLSPLNDGRGEELVQAARSAYRGDHRRERAPEG